METGPVSTDDAIISTDVDRLIRLISEKRKVSLSELHALSGIKNKAVLETWVRVLEDEGYVHVEYGLTGTYVRWAGEEQYQVAKKEEEKPVEKQESPYGPGYYTKEDEYLFRMGEKNGHWKKEEKVADTYPSAKIQNEEKTEEKAEDEREEETEEDKILNAEYSDDDKSPEDLLEEYIKMRRRSIYKEETKDETSEEEETEEDRNEQFTEKKYETRIGSVKENILKNMRNDEEGSEEEKEDDLSYKTLDERDSLGEAEETEDANESYEMKQEEFSPDHMAELDRLEPAVLHEERKISEEREDRPSPRSVYDSDVRDVMSAYMEEIKEEKAKLEQLRKKKEMLYKEEMAALEQKAEGELLSFMDYVLQRENKLVELREGVLELPEKVESVIQLQEELKRLRNEGKTSLGATKKRVDNFIMDIKSSEKELRGRIAALRAGIEENEKRVDVLDRLRQSIEARSEKINFSMDSIKGKVDDLNKAMASLDEYLAETKEMKTEIDNTADEVKTDIATKQDEVSVLENDLEGVSRLAGWVREYLNDYESKISEIEEHVKKGDEEIAKLKEAAEAKYIHKYLSELESIGGQYKSSLSHIIKTDKEIEAEMEKAKDRISELLSSSQKIVRRVGEQVDKSPDYDTVRKRVEERTARLKKTVEEKAREKGNLSDEIKKKKKKK